MKKKLEGLSGAEFDRAYMTHMVEAHEKSVELFNETAVSAQGDVQNFARKTLPTLKTHLSDAEELVRSLNSAAAGRESGPAR